MVALAFIWILISVISFILGTGILRLLVVSSIDRHGDRLVLTLWLGFLTMNVMLLASSVIAPITPFSGGLTTVLPAFILLMLPSVRKDVCALRSMLSPSHLVSGLIVLSIVSFAGAQIISHRDAINYQSDIIHWLSRTGCVPGLGLIHCRFGILSSWYCAPALFNHGFLTGRTGTVSNCYALLLVSGHLLIVGTRILKGTARSMDWFTALAFPMALIFPLMVHYPQSTRPDIAVVMMTIVITWALLTMHQEVDPVDRSNVATCRNGNLIILWLAACALTIKLSAIPLVALSALAYSLRTGFRPRSILTGALLGLLIVLPLMVALTIVTGCPIYPFPFCLDLPWAVDESVAALEAKTVFVCTRWGSLDRPASVIGAQYLSWRWLKHWLNSDILRIIGFAYFILSCLSATWIIARFRRRWREVWVPLLLGIGGITFLIAKAPAPRFGWGYLSVIPASLGILYADDLNRIAKGVAARLSLQRFAILVSLTGVTLFILPTLAHQTKSERRIEEAFCEGRLVREPISSLLVPPVVLNLEYGDDKDVASERRAYLDNEAAYLRSNRPMWYPLIPGDGVRFRNPDLGPYGGFLRDER